MLPSPRKFDRNTQWDRTFTCLVSFFSGGGAAGKFSTVFAFLCWVFGAPALNLQRVN